MQELDCSIVHRNLETKLKIGGLEALDLLAVLIFAAVMSLFFGSGTLGFIFVFILPLVLLITLYFLKRNRPDGYLLNLLRFSLLAGHFSASQMPEDEEKLLTRITKNGENKND
jgi:ABC-type multidrug transport system fused ATPase/permease subunit